MMARPTCGPPPINIEPENCPEAVILWQKLTSEENYKRQCALNRDLSLQAKKHLCFLGWKFYYVNKKERWELRYTSPITAKNYISLTRACQACIQEGGCNNIPNPDHINVVQSSSSAPRNKTNKRKKRQKGYDDEFGEASSSMNNNGMRKGKVLRTLRKMRLEGSQQRHRRTIIPWLIDNNVVALYSPVFCRDSKNAIKKGKLWRSGIACECCGMFFSPTRFEAHAGCNKHRPNATIFLEDGRSLLDCQKEALGKSSQQNVRPLIKKEEEREYQNDSICAVCCYGGELVLCDRCPSSFHLTCLGLEHVPGGDWFCPACCCKICKRPRCTQDNVDADRVLVCVQCEGRYHIGCLKAPPCTNMGDELLEDRLVDNGNWFCNGDCKKIFLRLQKLVGKPVTVGADNHLTWTLLKAVKSGSSGDQSDLTWDEIEGLSQNIRKLRVALNVLRDSFGPVIDGFLGRDMMADVVFSRASEVNRLNFRGFYTVVLERDEEVVSVATIRIFGKRVAEIPFVATRVLCRKQGMCGILMNEIEKQLTHLGVEEIVLPSLPNVIDTWTNSFGFLRMTGSVKYQFLDLVFLIFEDTIMCHKPLLVKQTVI